MASYVVNAYSIAIYSRRIYPGLFVNKINQYYNSLILKDTQSKSQPGLTLQF